MAIGNVAMATMGWYSSVAADTPGSIPDGEEIHGWGWIDGTVASTAAGEEQQVKKGMRWWSFIDMRYRRHR